MLINFDPDAFVLTPPEPPPAKRKYSSRRPISEDIKREKLLRYYEQSNNLMLFDEVLDLLSKPLFEESKSDRRGVRIADDDDPRFDEVGPDIEYTPAGPAMFEVKGLKWSAEALHDLQVQTLYASLDELSLDFNEKEKWDVLRWISEPALVKEYMWDKKLGKSHCLATHENDHPFSFANCCKAARADMDVIRDGIRARLPEAVLKALDRLTTY